jgi:methyl-accepting chemotaxis protein
LGLNAAIEAARAGEHGRGFSVVAEEIRRMSLNSTKSVQDVREILIQIDRLIKTISEKVADVAGVGQQLSASAQQMSSTVENLFNVVGDLENICEII